MTADALSVEDLLHQASRKIDRRDAETLLLHLLGKNRAFLLAHPETRVDAATQVLFADRVRRRAQHEPIQYLTGEQEFFGLPLQVTPDVLIPRPETELLVEAVLDFLKLPGTPARVPPISIVDVGTGSGAIALALAAHLPGRQITALDASEAALAVAQRNAERLGLVGIRFLFSDLLSAVRQERSTWDVVVSNPPYIPWSDGNTLAPEVRDFEPHLALFAGQDGLALYRRLLPEAWDALRPGGLLALEIGHGQKEAISALLAGWHAVRFHDDYAGIPRVALAQRPEISTESGLVF